MQIGALVSIELLDVPHEQIQENNTIEKAIQDDNFKDRKIKLKIWNIWAIVRSFLFLYHEQIIPNIHIKQIQAGTSAS